MTGKEFAYIYSIIYNEGFHYAFHHYDDFKDIKDEEFHRLREQYIEATKALADYLGVKL